MFNFFFLFFRLKATRKNYEQVLEIAEHKPVLLYIYDHKNPKQKKSDFFQAQKKFENETDILLADINCTDDPLICDEFSFIHKKPLIIELFRGSKQAFPEMDITFANIVQKCEDAKSAASQYFETIRQNQGTKKRKIESILMNPMHKYFNRDQDDPTFQFDSKKISENLQEEKANLILKQQNDLKNQRILFSYVILIIFVLIIYVIFSFHKNRSPKEE